MLVKANHEETQALNELNTEKREKRIYRTAKVKQREDCNE